MPKFQGYANRHATVPLVVPSGWVEQLNAAATERGISRSDLIREAIRQAGLVADLSPGRPDGVKPVEVAAATSTAGVQEN